MLELEGITVGKLYHFFDDGKLRESRHFEAKVLEIIPFDDIKDVLFTTYDLYCNDFIPKRFEEIWQDNVICSDHLYANETDYVIKTRIEKYDDNDIYFVRTKDGGWFSIDIESSWQSGRLDVDGEKYANMIRIYDTLKL